MTLSKRQVVLLALALLIVAAHGSAIFNLAVSPASAQDGGGNVLWKQECPWRGTIEARVLNNSLVVMCIEHR